jgi:F0F1-type ATP synthase assembly protein I
MTAASIIMQKPTPKQVAAKKLLFAAFLEALAVIAGLIAYFLTANWVWLAIGILGGLAFTLPAVIVFIRASMEERDRAS